MRTGATPTARRARRLSAPRNTAPRFVVRHEIDDGAALARRARLFDPDGTRARATPTARGSKRDGHGEAGESARREGRHPRVVVRTESDDGAALAPRGRNVKRPRGAPRSPRLARPRATGDDGFELRE